MGKIHDLVKHRSVIDRKKQGDISQAPEMQELKHLFDDMTEQEQHRTMEYIGEGGKHGQGTRD